MARTARRMIMIDPQDPLFVVDLFIESPMAFEAFFFPGDNDSIQTAGGPGMLH